MTRSEVVYILHLIAIGLAAGLKAVAAEVERPVVAGTGPRPRETAPWDLPPG